MTSENQVPSYNRTKQWWKVTTEGDCEGKTTTDLGVWYGEIDDIARRLANKCYYALQFRAVDEPVPENLPDPVEAGKKVCISLDVSSGTWPKVNIGTFNKGMTNEERIAFYKNLLKDRPVEVLEIGGYASVKIRFRDA